MDSNCTVDKETAYVECTKYIHFVNYEEVKRVLVIDESDYTYGSWIVDNISLYWLNGAIMCYLSLRYTSSCIFHICVLIKV